MKTVHDVRCLFTFCVFVIVHLESGFSKKPKHVAGYFQRQGLLGVFSKLLEANVSFNMSVRPYVWSNSALTGRKFIKFEYFSKIFLFISKIFFYGKYLSYEKFFTENIFYEKNFLRKIFFTENIFVLRKIFFKENTCFTEIFLRKIFFSREIFLFYGKFFYGKNFCFTENICFTEIFFLRKIFLFYGKYFCFTENIFLQKIFLFYGKYFFTENIFVLRKTKQPGIESSHDRTTNQQGMLHVIAYSTSN